MVKRCGKSAPREAQATRHGKPHRVQDQIGNPGAARSISAKADGFRVLVAKTNDSLRRKAQTKFGLQPFQNHFCFTAEPRSPDPARNDSPPYAPFLETGAPRVFLPASALEAGSKLRFHWAGVSPQVIRTTLMCACVIGAWNFSGAWSLELGVLVRLRFGSLRSASQVGGSIFL